MEYPIMITTKLLISALKTKAKITSDYGLAKRLGVSKNAVSSWQNERAKIGEFAAQEIANILSIDVCILYAALQSERTTDYSSKVIWGSIYNKLNGNEAAQRLIDQVFPDGLPDDLKV